MDISEAAMDARARRSAKRMGLLAIKSRRLRGTADNRGGYMLIDPTRNAVWAGERCDLSAEDVNEMCNQ
jgi:hypothetical protein